MSDGLDRIVAQKKQCIFSNSIKITQKNVFFSDFIRLYEYWGNFHCSYETKKHFIETIIRLILDEVIMSDRFMSDGQMYSFLIFVFNTEKIRLN